MRPERERELSAPTNGERHHGGMSFRKTLTAALWRFFATIGAVDTYEERVSTKCEVMINSQLGGGRCSKLTMGD